MRRPSDPGVTVCRCEEVTVAEIKRVIAHGCLGPNQAKAFTRCGMGPCQGRMCATPVSEMFAERQHAGVGVVGHYRIRPPVKPLTVGELAALEGAGTAPADRPSALIRPKQAQVLAADADSPVGVIREFPNHVGDGATRSTETGTR